MLRLAMLKTARKLYGYTQEELAQKIGKAQRYYTQIENGSSKSAPLIKQLSSILKLKESFLGASDEYIEYPFLSDFYVFCLADKDLPYLYKEIVENICSKSDFIDVVFLLGRPSLIGVLPKSGGYPVMYVALRDDRDTVFLFKRQLKTRNFSLVKKDDIINNKSSLDASQWLSGRQLEIRTFSRVDYFRDRLQLMRGTYVYEITKTVSEELYNRIEEESVTREDIVTLFPKTDYFENLFQAHNKIKKR